MRIKKQQSPFPKQDAEKTTWILGLLLTGARNGKRSNIDSEHKG
jgi:hypothetical protein